MLSRLLIRTAPPGETKLAVGTVFYFKYYTKQCELVVLRDSGESSASDSPQRCLDDCSTI
jgi:hypothetical protein